MAVRARRRSVTAMPLERYKFADAGPCQLTRRRSNLEHLARPFRDHELAGCSVDHAATFISGTDSQPPGVCERAREVN